MHPLPVARKEPNAKETQLLDFDEWVSDLMLRFLESNKKECVNLDIFFLVFKNCPYSFYKFGGLGRIWTRFLERISSVPREALGFVPCFVPVPTSSERRHFPEG